MRRHLRIPPRLPWEIDRTGVNWGPVGHPDIAAETHHYQQQLERVRRLENGDADDLEQARADLRKAEAEMQIAWLSAKPTLPVSGPPPSHERLSRESVRWHWVLLYAALSYSRAKALRVYWAVQRRRP